MTARKKLGLTAAACLLVSAGAAQASVTYNMILTPTSGPSIGGTGVFTLDSAPCVTPINCISDYRRTPVGGSGTILALSITLGTDTFTLANDTNPGDNPLIRFIQGNINTIVYHGFLPASGDDLQMTDRYVYWQPSTRGQTIGTYLVTVAPAARAVPEPASLALLGAGFGLLGFASRRRQAKRA